MKKTLVLFLIILAAALADGGVAVSQSANRAQHNARVLAGELDRSFLTRSGWWLDKEKVYNALAGDASYRNNLQAEYSKLTGAGLKSHLNRLGADTGVDVIQAKLLLDQGRLTTVDEIFLSTSGAGTDERRLSAALASIDESQRIKFQDEWTRKYGPRGFYYQGGASSPVAAIEGDLSGSDRELALKLYRAYVLTDSELDRVGQLAGRDAQSVAEEQVRRTADKLAPATGKSREELIEEIKRVQEQQRQSPSDLPAALPQAQPLPQAECGPAGSGYRLCVALPGQSQDVAGLGDYIRLLYQFALGIAGVVVFLRIIMGGIMYTLSAGNVASRSEAWAIITQAILGLVLLLAAVLALYIIDPKLLDLRAGLRSARPVDFNLSQPRPPAIQKRGLVPTPPAPR